MTQSAETLRRRFTTVLDDHAVYADANGWVCTCGQRGAPGGGEPGRDHLVAKLVEVVS
jgi:hypothetical protein